MSKHPLQKIHIVDGVGRFQENAIVRYLLDAGPFDMNQLAMMEFSREDCQQFAQLIGYSVCGFGELSYVSDKAYGKAVKKMNELLADKGGEGKPKQP